MKKLFAGIILSLAAVAAMAMPRPSEIESALAARDYQSARSMTQEVLRERPDSAKAHLFNAYILAKEGNTVAASEELKNVNRLDRNNEGRSVRGSALYGRTVAELERAPVQRAAPKPSYSAPTYAPSTTYVTTPVGESALWKVIKWMFWLTIIGVAVWWLYKVFFERRKVQEPVYVSLHSTPTAPSLPAGGGFQPQYSNRGRLYDAPAHAIPVQHVAAQPSTVVVNNSGNHGNDMLTGMLLADAMHHHHDHGHSHNHRDTYVEREYVAPAPSYSAPTYEAPRTTDYETSRSSFSSGSDDDWKSSSSSSSSSSSDYSSGGSDWGSSSSDSGGGGGSDW